MQYNNHPELLAHWETYRKIANFTDGGVERVGEYLKPYITEQDNASAGHSHYYYRLERLYNKNFCDRPLTLHLGHLSRSITIQGIENTAVEEILADVTGFGQGYLQVARDRLWYYMRDGRVATLVDRQKAQDVKNRDREVATGSRSYQIIYEASHIRDWSYFVDGPKKGKLSMVMLYEGVRKIWGKSRDTYLLFYYAADEMGQPDVPASQPKTYRWQRIASKDEAKGKPSETFEAEVYEEGDGELEDIPVVIWGAGPEESFVKDIVPLNLAHMNINSVKSNVLFNTGFQRSIVVGANPEEFEKAGEWLATILRNEEARIFTIPAGDAAGLEGEVSSLERFMERLGKFEVNQMADDSRQVQSADSKAKDLVARKAIYNATCDAWAAVERRIYELHAAFEGADGVTITVSVDRDFGLDDVTEESQKLQLVFTNARELGVVAIQKQVLKTQLTQVRLVPNPGESEEEMRTRLFEAVDKVSEEKPQSGVGDLLGNLLGPRTPQ